MVVRTLIIRFQADLAGAHFNTPLHESELMHVER